jgi:DNA-binding PadR family transcriptional regulator
MSLDSRLKELTDTVAAHTLDLNLQKLTKVEAADYRSEIEKVRKFFEITDQGFDRAKVQIQNIEHFVDIYLPIRMAKECNSFM